MKIDLSQIPEHALETVRIFAAVEGVTLKTPEEFRQYIRDDEEALDVVRPYIDADL